MMSRITLHLRKQAHTDDSIAQLPTLSLPSRRTSRACSRLRFNHSAGLTQSASDPRVAVVVGESVMAPDDRGNVLDESSERGQAKYYATEEWFEMCPRAPVRLASSRSVQRMVGESPELRFAV